MGSDAYKIKHQPNKGLTGRKKKEDEEKKQN